jgi:nucleoside 2-deoxyribosyltransferase
MKVYIAARYSRKSEVAEVATRLLAHNIYVTSTWHLEPHGGDVQLAQVRNEMLHEYAERDLAEIREADTLLALSESDQTYNRRGGRHVEFGYALALNRDIAVVGPRENIFHWIPTIRHYNMLEEFLAAVS